MNGKVMFTEADLGVELAALHGSGAFPLEVAKRPPAPSLNFAQDSAKVVSSERPSYAFGINKENPAAQLRLMADHLEAGDLAVQGVSHFTRASLDDFTMHWVSIEFAPRYEGAPKHDELGPIDP